MFVQRGRFRGGAFVDHLEDAEDDDSRGPPWLLRGQNRSQRKHPSDNTSNENSEPNHSTDQSSANNLNLESKSEQSLNSDETTSPINDNMDDDPPSNVEEKSDRNNRGKTSKTNSMSIENRGRRYYDGNTNNNRRGNDRDRSSWQDRSGGNSGNNNPNNSRFRSDMNSNANHGPPLCKFFMENRCMKVSGRL